MPTTFEALESELIAFRRDLHTHPELSRREYRTTGVVAERIEAAGFTVRLLPVSGLVADVGAEHPAYRVAREDARFRALIDRVQAGAPESR